MNEDLCWETVEGDGSKYLANDEVRVRWRCGESGRCLEMEDKITKANQKYGLLELDIEEKKTIIQQLEDKLGFMELKMLKFEHEVSLLRQRIEDLETRIQNSERANKEYEVVHLTVAEDEDDKIMKLMIENSVLECEKKKSECAVDCWITNYKKLEMQVGELQKRLLAETAEKGLDFPDLDSVKLNGKCELNPVPTSPVQIDNGNQLNEDDGVTASTLGGTPSKYVNADETRKRRRVSKVVISESESDDDCPICKLMHKHQQSHDLNANLNSNSECDADSWDNIESSKPRRRLMRQRNFSEKGVSRKNTYKSNESNNIIGIPTTEFAEEEIELDVACSEGESLGGFIVNSSEVSDDDISADNISSESENSSYTILDYEEIMSRLRREIKPKMKWEFEADMLADFGKDPEICMKHVLFIVSKHQRSNLAKQQ